jgi:outer membrane immunogenic protein
MRRFLFALAAGAALISGTASAADLPVKAAPAYVTPAPVSIWAGGYVGANLGYGWGRAEATVNGVTGSQDLDGVIGGGQIGYNWQWASPLVLGIEADFQGSGQKHDTVIGAATITNSISWFATLRGRIGYAPSNWMIYATGGLAYGEFRSEATLNGVNANISDTRAGWTAGGGVEWMFAPKWSAKLEYLYIDTGSFDSTVAGVPFTGRLNDNIVRVGVNYHF